MLEIPLLNPVRFVPIELNKKEFDGDWFSKLLYDWQYKINYFQKFENGDNIIINVWSDSEPSLSLIDCNNLKIESYNFIQDGLNVDGLDSYSCVVVTEELEGTYYLNINDVFISEPIQISDKFENTILISYKDRLNNFGIPFYTTNNFISMYFRIEGYILDFQPVSNDTLYQDQNMSNILLHSTPYRNFKLYIGNKDGVPDWTIDKINRIISCSDWNVDGKSFSKTDDSEWERQSNSNYFAMSGWSISISEKNNDLTISYEQKNILGTGNENEALTDNNLIANE